MSGSVILDRDGRGVATLTLNRPETRNAFDDRLIAELSGLLEEVGADASVRAVVLTGAGASFSAGADLNWMKRAAQYGEAENLADAEALGRLMAALDRLPKPTIGMINGAAYGGGVGLAACCDIAVASETATFCLSEVRLGLIPAVISPYVVAAIGPRQGRRWFATAEVIPAAKALDIGLVHEVAPPDALGEVVERLLAAILKGAPQAQADAKALVAVVGGPVTAEIVADTARRIAARRATAEAREGLAAFLEKRPPSWRGEPS